MSGLLLAIVYNHQYNENIDKLEDIYKGRFANIVHLVPFYSGKKKNVYSIYENSYFFQGYIAQSSRFILNDQYDHYLFLADDIYLNPNINEINYKEHFKLKINSSFLPNIIELCKKRDFWMRIVDAQKFRLKYSGVECYKYLPAQSSAIEKFDKFNISYSRPKIFSKAFYSCNFFELLKKIFFYKNIFGINQSYEYPLAGGYSDIIIVDKKSFKKFAEISGIFSALRLHVELAIPTALILSADEIVTENQLKLKGMPLWSSEDMKYLNKFELKIDNLKNNFPKDILYIHPIKISKYH